MLDIRLHDLVTLAMQELPWLLLVQIMQYKLCLLVHLATIGQVRTYLADFLTAAVDIVRSHFAVI